MRPIRTHAAGFVAKAMANTPPNLREALLVSMMQHALNGLRVITTAEHAAEEAYRAADDLAVREGV